MKKQLNNTNEVKVPIKLKLSLMERMSFASVLPIKGSIMEMDLAETLEKRVRCTQEEEREFELVIYPDSRYAFNPAKVRLREFTFESFEILFIQQGCKILEETKNVGRHNKELVKKFLEIKVDSRK